MTPSEFSLYAEVFNEKKEQESHEKMRLVWLGAYWQRIENLEPFENYLNKKQEEKLKEMSMEEMIVKVYELNVKWAEL
jgi:hypothetical protein